MSERIEEYDKKGNLIYSKNSSGYEYWREFDENNNLIHYKNSYGDKGWYEYDDSNNYIYYKNSDGKESWYKYDENNEQIEISQQEFEKIKKEKSRRIINNSRISRFELMDI